MRYYRRNSSEKRSRSRSRFEYRKGRHHDDQGMTVVNIKLMENGTHLNEELRIYSDSLGQIIIVEIARKNLRD